MKSSLLVLLLIVSSSFTLMAQTCIDQSKNRVISTNGLRLRAKPSIASEKLAVIPYDETVNVISPESFGFEAIGCYEFYYPNSTTNEFVAETTPIEGHWIKVKYNQEIGYVFDAYLYWSDLDEWEDEVESEETVLGLNKDFQLLFPGENCADDSAYDPSLRWYGVYRNNGKVTLEQVTVGFFSNFERGSLCGITTNNNKNLCFIIGSSLRLPMGTIDGNFYGFYLENTLIKQGKINTNFLKQHELAITVEDFEEWFVSGELLIEKEGKKQTLNATNYNFSKAINNVVWSGDLDGDGKLDYIIDYGEVHYETVLYLSSQATNDEIVKPVAAYYSGSCC